MHFKNWFFSRFLLVFYLAFWVKNSMLEIIKTVLFLSVYVFLDWLWLDHFIRTSFVLKTLHCIIKEIKKPNAEAFGVTVEKDTLFHVVI